MRWSGTGGPVKFAFLDTSGNIRWRFGGGTNDGDGLAGIANDAVAANIFPMGETVLVVAKVLVRATANDVASMNVYRAGDTVPLAEPATWQVSGNSASGVPPTRLQIRHYFDLPAEVDEIRVGRAYTNVVSPVASGPPVFIKQPVGATVYEGMTAQLDAAATGAIPMTYQWRRNSQPVPGASERVLLLTYLQPAQAGTYTLYVTNSAGAATSSPAVLGVIAATNLNVGLAGRWRMDETTSLVAHDASPNVNDGALVNFAGNNSQWIAGYYGGALAFVGNNYVEVPDSPTLRSNLISGFSVAAWFRSAVPLSATANAYRMLEKENSFFFLQDDGNVNNLGVGGMKLLVKKANANLSVGIGQALDANR